MTAGRACVEVATESAGPEWDSYVAQDPASSAYHQSAWLRVITETFRHPLHCLVARQGKVIVGLLPLVEMRSRLFGHFFVSLPFVNYGGVLGDSPEVMVALATRAAELASGAGAQFVELRHESPVPINWSSSTHKVSMRVPVPATADQYFASLSSRLRGKIRKAQKHGYMVQWGGAELVPDFYNVFAVNMRHLGTPVMPLRWFENVLRLTGEGTRILMLFEGDRAVAGTIATADRKLLELPWIASLPESRKHYSTVLLYWTAAEWAIQQGFSSLDLGRCTPGGGTWEFKRQWNAEECALHWHYWLPQGAAVPHLRPDNPKYRMAIAVWQRLPLWLTTALGPRIVRHIP